MISPTLRVPVHGQQHCMDSVTFGVRTTTAATAADGPKVNHIRYKPQLLIEAAWPERQ
jgi:hypothetical protein